MAEGFLKGIWGKPTQRGTGIMGIWGTIKRVPNSIFKTIMSPIKAVGILITGTIVFFLYMRYRKK